MTEETKNEIEIRPCPFCGHEPEVRTVVIYSNGEKSPEIVRCRYCHVSIAASEQGRAVEKWNTRPLEDALRAELAAMTAERDHLNNELDAVTKAGTRDANLAVSLYQELRQVKADVEQLREANEKTYCAFCGEEFLRDDQAASRVSEHIRTCEKHPMRKVEEELQDEKFAHWQADQALNTAQQEINELHALNLYDLVGDSDQLRADMVATIKERDELRMSVERLRGNIGMEIARHAWTKAELQQAKSNLEYTIHLLELEKAESKRARAELQQAREALDTAIVHIEDITKNGAWVIGDKYELEWVGDDDAILYAREWVKQQEANV